MPAAVQTAKTKVMIRQPLRTTPRKNVDQCNLQKALAASQLRQPGLPQGSRPDWLLSRRAHVKMDSRGGLLLLLLNGHIILIE